MYAEDGALPLEPWAGPAILLVDMDAFFASVEQMDHPEWRGKPVIVGGDADKRGVVATCSYEARKYGVHAAMPSSTARRLCPDAIWTRGRFGRYREVSDAAMSVIRDETPLVQQVSIDEAFADITPTRANTEHPVLVAQRIQERIAKLGVTCSVGIGTTKAVAKIASDMDKPQGMTVVYPGTERSFLSELPVRALSGVGASAEAKLQSRGIRTLGEMADADIESLRRVFGSSAETMQARAKGEDASPVTTEREVKSVSHEQSFAKDLTTKAEIESALSTLLAKVGRRLRAKGLAGTTLTLKIRYEDRTLHTAQTHLDTPSDDDIEMRPRLMSMVPKVWRPGQRVRLLGVAVSGFGEMPPGQQSLFGFGPGMMDDGVGGTEERPLIEDEEKRRSLLSAFDVLKDKFGEGAVRFGNELGTEGNSTGTTSKNPGDYR